MVILAHQVSSTSQKGNRNMEKTSLYITLSDIIVVVGDRINEREIQIEDLESQGRKNSYQWKGYVERLDIARALYQRLGSAQKPSRHEIAAYCGKGSRGIWEK
jgi:hypothetical protein